MHRIHLRAACVLVLLLQGVLVSAQQPPAKEPAKPQAAPAPPADALGRHTPRGTVLGFLSAVQTGRDDVAVLYLNTTLRDKAASDLAHKLYVVLDTRLPVRLSEVSHQPEGSRAYPLHPDRDRIGTITTGHGSLEITVERVQRGSLGALWLISRETLQAIPDVYDEINLISVDRYLPAFLTWRIGGIRLFQWLVLVLMVPAVYRLLGTLGTLLERPCEPLRRRFHISAQSWELLSGPLRLAVLVIVLRLGSGTIDQPLIERQFWAVVRAMLLTVSVVWFFLLLNGIVERYLRRHLQSSRFGEITALLRFVRRIADVFVVAGGVLATLRYFGIDATAALAGVGIGGIAVALAAQKTLENVIGGVSMIFDNAVHVGDFVKVGDTVGTVESIGLRSTRIRTLDRTMLSLPNGQISSGGIETLSARDKFWFHHFLALDYGTTSVQMRAVIDGIRDLLAGHGATDHEMIRVRFFRLGAFSADVEIFTYLVANDWERFLEIQEELLLGVMEIVERAGTTIALPSQTLRVSDSRLPASIAGP
jgi:MscS family membrane protein